MEIKIQKLDLTKDCYEQPFGWVGHPDGGGGYGKGTPDASLDLIGHRGDIEIFGGIVDPDASYSYDDWALVRLRDQFYMLSTSGCSCPSPSETWHVEIGPATLDEIRKHVTSGKYDGYTMPKTHEDKFLDLIDSARAYVDAEG